MLGLSVNDPDAIIPFFSNAPQSINELTFESGSRSCKKKFDSYKEIFTGVSPKIESMV